MTRKFMKLRSEQEIIDSWTGDYSQPLVSVLCITFNHEKYVEDALLGFLSQYTSFPFEILIHDDASTDSTASIIVNYQKRYPRIIKSIIQTENKYSKGVKIFSTYLWPLATGKYFSTCEGDDYWVDDRKLEKQVNFLELNNKYSACSCYSLLLRDGDASPSLKVTPKFLILTMAKFSLGYKPEVRTVSLMYRSCIRSIYKPEIADTISYGDNYVKYLILSMGPAAVLPEYMTFYRVHIGGVYSLAPAYEKFRKKQSDLRKFISISKGVVRLGFVLQFLWLKFYFSIVLFSRPFRKVVK